MLRYLLIVADYSKAAARSSHCWFSVDRVAGDAETTAWKRLARLRQSQWREGRGYPIGSHPHGGGDEATPVGSSAFDAAIELDIGGGLLGLIGIETKYHEHAVVAAVPKAPALARYLEVTERSGAFTDGWRERVVGTALQQIWQDHLLALSMLQHPSGRWAWARFVLLYPAANASFARAATAYRTLLRDTTTFEARTIDELIAAPEALPGITKARLLERYF